METIEEKTEECQGDKAQQISLPDWTNLSVCYTTQTIQCQYRGDTRFIDKQLFKECRYKEKKHGKEL